MRYGPMGGRADERALLWRMLAHEDLLGRTTMVTVAVTVVVRGKVRMSPESRPYAGGRQPDQDAPLVAVRRPRQRPSAGHRSTPGVPGRRRR